MGLIFISYSHDSAAHAERVLSFSQRLRKDGYETSLDQYVEGSPPEGWPRWMLNQLDKASFVLIVCTETYYLRFRGLERPGVGRGVDWEGNLITQSLYAQRSQDVKFLPVIFSPGCEQYIPEPLRGASFYTLTSQEGYDRLRERLEGVAGVEPPPVGERQPLKRRTVEPMEFPGTEEPSRPPGDLRRAPDENPFRLTITAEEEELRGSRSPIVIALEEERNPLREGELLQTERHLTVGLSSDAVATLRRIAEALDNPALSPSELTNYGGRAWQELKRAQGRLPVLLDRVKQSTIPQPVAWTGRTELLVCLHRALLAAHRSGNNQLEEFVSVGYGANFFNPIGENRHEWQVQRRPAETPAVLVSHLGSAEDSRSRLLEAAASDVAVLLSDSPDGIWGFSHALQKLSESRTRVAIGFGQTQVEARDINNALRRLPCICLGGPALRDERLAEALREAFEGVGPTQAAPCIIAAIRRLVLANAQASGNVTAFLQGLFWTTWCWIGRPLFSQGFCETLIPAAYPHLMDLRAPAARDWYFNRRKGIPEAYEADKMSRASVPEAEADKMSRATAEKDLFHLYLSGAGGTGKSCFLNYVYETYRKRSDVLPVWYRVDVPSPEWADLQERILKALRAAARSRDCEYVVPNGYQDLRDVLREAVKRLQRPDAKVRQIVLFIDQLERSFESGDEPDYGRLTRISDAITDLLAYVHPRQGVRIFIASRKQYLPDFLRSFRTAEACRLEFNVLQTISDPTEQTGFITHVLRWCQRENLLAPSVNFDTRAAEFLAVKVKGHPLNLMLALIQIFSRGPAGTITQQLLESKEYRPWEKLFHLDLQLANKDDVDWFFLLAMAHARTEIVRQEEVWWRLRLVTPKLTRRVEELRPSGVLERLWLLGFLGRTIYPRDFGGQAARFLEFFHANLRDYLLQLMGQGGGEIALPRQRCETPSAWRALDRLSIAAHEWEQTQQLLPPDDVASLMEQRDITVEKNVREGESEEPPFFLLFLRDIEEARPRLCRAASECFAYSAVVHDNLGRWAIEKLFSDPEDRVQCCRYWLQRCVRESRGPILRYLIESKAPEALQLICTIVLSEVGSRETPGIPVDLWKDVAAVLNRPLYAARYRTDVVAAVLESSVALDHAATSGAAGRVREFVATACNADPNDITQLVSHCVDRFRGSQDLKLQAFAESLDSVEHGAWLAGVAPDTSLYSELDPRERASRTRLPLQLCSGKALLNIIDAERIKRWRSEVSNRLGIPLPEFDLVEGELDENELELRVHGQSIALGEFVPGRVQVLRRHWFRTQTGLPPDSIITQNDALQELVLWVDPSVLRQVSWERAFQDFDEAMVGWLAEVLRNSVDHYFGFDLLAEFLSEIPTLRDTGQLFLSVQPQLLRQVVVNLVEERVPLSTHRQELINEFQQIVGEVKDVTVLTQKLREQVGYALCRRFVDASNQLPVLTVEETLDDSLAGQISSPESGRFLRLNAERALALASEVRAYFEVHHSNDVYPVVVCSPVLRYPLSSMLRRFDPRVSVLSFSEVPLEIAVSPAGLVTGRWTGRQPAQHGEASA